MTIPKWEPTKFVRPSPSHKGEIAPEVVYVEVGRALHAWEHAESALTRLFQVFCESTSIAACRAYGVIESPFTKAQTLRQTAEAFFGRRDLSDSEDYADAKSLIAAYENGSKYRNNIAHGMTVGHHLADNSHSGYFLCPPSYTSKKVKRHATTEVYLLGAEYFYTARDVLHYTERFRVILAEAMRIASNLNEKHSVLPVGELHP